MAIPVAPPATNPAATGKGACCGIEYTRTHLDSNPLVCWFPIHHSGGGGSSHSGGGVGGGVYLGTHRVRPIGSLGRPGPPDVQDMFRCPVQLRSSQLRPFVLVRYLLL